EALAKRCELRRVSVCRCRSEEPDHRHRWLLPSRAPHLGREQQTAATEQCNELTPLAVEHRGLPPLCAISAADWPVRSVFRTPSLPQGGLQVLGANLKCSESRDWAACPSYGSTPNQDSGSRLRTHPILRLARRETPSAKRM